MAAMAKRQRSALRMVHDAGALAATLDVDEAWMFETAAEALANDDLDEADRQLEIVDGEIDNQSVLVPARDARQLIIAIRERCSE